MSKAETVRTGKLGKADLRLVRKDGRLLDSPTARSA
jgi:hypothetical protein